MAFPTSQFASVAPLFLPFTPNGKATELRAIEVKRRIEIRADAAVDPFTVLPRLPAQLFDPEELRRLSPILACALFHEHAHYWSGMVIARVESTGESIILLNPTHADTRKRATLMEEIVHIVLDHPATALSVDGRSGKGPALKTSAARSYDKAIEDEAYNVGAACLLPYPALFNAVSRGHEHASVIARREGLSVDHVEFRIKRAGLWRIYNKHCL